MMSTGCAALLSELSALLLLAGSAVGQTSALTPVKSAKPPETAASAADLMRAAAEKQRAAIAPQKEAVRKQAQLAGMLLQPWASASFAPPLDCEPVDDSVIAPVIETAAKAHNLQPALVRAVMEQESAMRPCAVSVKGAQGLMQLMPDTCSELGVKDPFDVKENVEAGAKYLKSLLDRFKGDLPRALGAYNAGPAAVGQSGGIPDIPETRDYINIIMKKLETRP